MLALASLRPALSTYQPRLVEISGQPRAAVALIFHEPEDELRLLFIERTQHQADPWSGHLAFPGGRLEAEDPNLRAAAERETREELGLDLGSAEFLGRLDDLTGATLPVLISAFVYAVENPGPLVLNPEVKEAFWVPVSRLLDPTRQRECRFPFRGLEHRLMPAIDLLGPGRPLLWGITYRFVARLLELNGYLLPRPDEPL